MSVLPVGFGSAAGGTPAGAIERSLRFNSADSAYLNRTFGTPTNNKKWTYNCWVKVNAAGNSIRMLTSGITGSPVDYAMFQFSPNAINYQETSSSATALNVSTVAVFRDPSSWYMVTLVVDTTLATATDRIKIYVNSVLQTLTITTQVTQNYDTVINKSTRLGGIGGLAYNGSYINFSDCLLTEANFIDGQALTPSSFGETDSATGVWKPKAYTGTYGTNGFYLKFADNSGTTSTTLGKDSSGNGNNWTPNGFSVTAGSGNDSLVDTPTSYGTDTGAGGEVRGNYCTINPLENPNSFTLTNGNLDIGGSNAWRGTRATMGVSSGKWYWEYVRTSATSGGGTGISNATYTWAQMSTSDPGTYAGGYIYLYNGQKGNNNSYVSYGASFGQNDVIGVAFDADNGTLTFYKNGASQGTAYTGITSGPYFPTDGGPFGGCTYNFGQRPFAYTAPSGFKALCTQNLPTPTIGATSTTQAGKYFNTVLYTGDYTTSKSITGVGFQPDFVWIKDRGLATVYNYSHALFDAVRGAGKWISTNRNDAELDYGTGTTSAFRSFNSDGFTVGQNYNTNEVDPTAESFVAWNWKANGAGSSNTAGTITSTVSANTTSGFSIVKYTGSSTGNDGTPGTVGHGLGIAPSLILFKPLDTYDGCAYHSGLTSASYRLVLFSSSGSLAETSDTGFFNGTAPTSTVFSVGTRKHSNSNGGMIAYCFAPVAGYSAFGKYTGNGSTNGPFVYLGFRPRFLIIKPSSGTTGVWYVWDSSRDPYNFVSHEIYANTSAAEYVNTPECDFVSNGFKMRSTFTDQNGSGNTYIYAAFAESPFKYSLAR